MQQYPPQQPYYQPPQFYAPQMSAPPPPPKKKSRAWLWIVLSVAGVLVCSCVGFAAVSASQQQSTITAPASVQSAGVTQAPTQGKWTTTHTFTGNGEKTTATFKTSGDWKLIWAAQASSGSEAFFGVSVYDASGNLIDTGATSTIPAGKQATDSTDEHTGAGSFYLKVYAGVPWTITIQELK